MRTKPSHSCPNRKLDSFYTQTSAERVADWNDDDWLKFGTYLEKAQQRSQQRTPHSEKRHETKPIDGLQIFIYLFLRKCVAAVGRGIRISTYNSLEFEFQFGSVKFKFPHRKYPISAFTFSMPSSRARILSEGWPRWHSSDWSAEERHVMMLMLLLLLDLELVVIVNIINDDGAENLLEYFRWPPNASASSVPLVLFGCDGIQGTRQQLLVFAGQANARSGPEIGGFSFILSEFPSPNGEGGREGGSERECVSISLSLITRNDFCWTGEGNGCTRLERKILCLFFSHVRLKSERPSNLKKTFQKPTSAFVILYYFIILPFCSPLREFTESLWFRVRYFSFFFILRVEKLWGASKPSHLFILSF